MMLKPAFNCRTAKTNCQMISLKRSNRGKQDKSPLLRAPLLIILTGLGLLLIAVQILANAGSYIHSWFIRVEHPVTFSFTAYNQLLSTHVKDGRVDYSGLSRSPDLEKAVRELEQISADHIVNPTDQLAFWINTYNLVNLKNIVEHYPLADVRKIEAASSGRKYIIGGTPLSAQDIQMQILTPMLYKEPRGLFLMCHGARGDPPLMDHALNRPHFDSDANTATYLFVNDPDNVFLEADSHTLYLSRYFQRNEAVLTNYAGSPHRFALMFLDPATRPLVELPDLKTAFLSKFDFRLNDANPGGK